MADEYTIKIYTRFTKDQKKPTFTFSVDTEAQVISHIKQLFRDGYRRLDSSGNLEWFPPHIIEWVEASGPGLSTGYNDVDVSTDI